MRGICGITVDHDKIFVSFSSFKGGKAVFMEEAALDVFCKEGRFLECLKQNSEALSCKIIEKEKQLSLKTEKVFINLPQGLVNKRLVEDIIPLKKKKKIVSHDLISTKKYLADIFLDWDDFCVHNFILNYEVDGQLYDTFPLGVKAKKIKVKALLLWVKDQLCKEAEDIVDNLGKNFGGFIWEDISVLTASFTKGYIEKHNRNIFCAVNIGYKMSQYVIYRAGKIAAGEEFDFGLNQIIQALEKNFFLTFSLAQEMFSQYVSFKDTPYFKEVSIKSENNYMKFSVQTINSFVKEYIKGKIIPVLDNIRVNLESGDEMIISFSGRMSSKDGFLNFVKTFLPAGITGVSMEKSGVSSSFGCSQYGIYRFLEEDYKRKQSLFQKAFNIYQEYF